MANRQTLLHIRSGEKDGVGPKMPSPDNISLGEIAINFSPGVEKLFIKNSDNKIVSFCTEEDIFNNENSLIKLITDNKNSIDNVSNKLSFYEGSTSVNSLEKVPISKRLVIATINGNQPSFPFSLDGIPNAGKEIHIFVTNNGTKNAVVALPTNSPYKTLSSNTLTIKSKETKEINAISDGTIIYIRAI